MPPEGRRYDVVVVGARCAGATLALGLARHGWDVQLLDRDQLVSEPLSTHFLFPNTLDRLDRLGVLDRLLARHDLPIVRQRVRLLEHEVVGSFTRVGRFDGGAAPRRSVLDCALLDAARDAGVHVRLGARVRALLGRGTETDPARGVLLDDGGEARARWVIGADGRTSQVAQALGLGRRDELRGELGILFAYWRGLPETEHVHLEVQRNRSLNLIPCEDGLHLVALNGLPPVTRGSAAERRARYLAGIRAFPSTLAERRLDTAQLVSDIRAAPETMLRGFFRQASGPGWALVGDAGHFKHPATAQGISDAVEQALFVADALAAGGDLADYEAWRDARAAEYYAWSFDFARWPTRSTERLFWGLASDAAAAQAFRDSFSRLVSPSDVFTPRRIVEWQARRRAEETQRVGRTCP